MYKLLINLPAHDYFKIFVVVCTYQYAIVCIGKIVLNWYFYLQIFISYFIFLFFLAYLKVLMLS